MSHQLQTLMTWSQQFQLMCLQMHQLLSCLDVRCSLQIHSYPLWTDRPYLAKSWRHATAHEQNAMHAMHMRKSCAKLVWKRRWKYGSADGSTDGSMEVPMEVWKCGSASVREGGMALYGLP